MNWDDTRIFLALSRTHSLRAAARSLGIDQATVGRRLNALESELGAKLFLRAKDGYLLTAAGEVALAAAKRMESAALDLRTKIEGQDENPGGLVRVTSTDSIAIDLLMPAIERLQQHWPHIRVDLEVSTQLLSLSRRQVDIAFRNVLPKAPDLLVRKGVAAGIGLGEMPVWMGEREGLVRIWPERRRANDYEVWQVMHPDLQRTARVRATAEFLSEAFQIG